MLKRLLKMVHGDQTQHAGRRRFFGTAVDGIVSNQMQAGQGNISALVIHHLGNLKNTYTGGIVTDL